MKVVIVGPTYPLRGGQALLLGHVYEALRRRGVETRVITFRQLYPRLLFPGKREGNVSESPVQRLESEAILTLMNPWTWRRALARIGEPEPPDVILMTWWNPVFGPLFRFLIRGVRRRYGIPTVMICENVVSHEGRAVDSLLTRMGLAGPAAFIVLSQAVGTELALYRPDAVPMYSRLPIYDCYGGGAADPEESRRRLGFRESRVVLFFGLVRAYKGLGVLIDAMAKVVSEVEDVRLLIVGEFYDGEGEHRASIERLGLADRTTVVAEYVPDEDVDQYFALADCVVLPYLSATQSGITQVAQGAGVPMIASRVGGLPETVIEGENGLLVEPGDPDALAAAIGRFFREDLGPILRARMASRSGEDEPAEDEIARHLEAWVGSNQS